MNNQKGTKSVVLENLRKIEVLVNFMKNCHCCGSLLLQLGGVSPNLDPPLGRLRWRSNGAFWEVVLDSFLVVHWGRVSGAYNG